MSSLSKQLKSRARRLLTPKGVPSHVTRLARREGKEKQRQKAREALRKAMLITPDGFSTKMKLQLQAAAKRMAEDPRARKFVERATLQQRVERLHAMAQIGKVSPPMTLESDPVAPELVPKPVREQLAETRRKLSSSQERHTISSIAQIAAQEAVQNKRRGPRQKRTNNGNDLDRAGAVVKGGAGAGEGSPAAGRGRARARKAGGASGAVGEQAGSGGDAGGQQQRAPGGRPVPAELRGIAERARQQLERASQRASEGSGVDAFGAADGAGAPERAGVAAGGDAG